MKTVIGFDSWTGGTINFSRLVAPLREKGFNFLLLHLGSWGGDKGRPKSEVIDNIDVRDISYYGGLGFEEILEKEGPAAVIFLSNDVFAHRAFNRYCKLKGIPTLNLYHGLVGIQSIKGGRQYEVNLLNQMMYVLARVPKALLKVWPVYAGALLRSGAPMRDWCRFGTDIVDLTLGRYIASAAPDSQTTVCAVYTNADIVHAEAKYKFSRDDIYVVGNPDLAKFGLDGEVLGMALFPRPRVTNEVVYIDTGLLYAGMVFRDATDFIRHLTFTSESLQREGLRFSVKLHPDHFRTGTPNVISETGIRVLSNEDFLPSLKTCCAAIVEPSTAGLIPALLGLPVFLAAFGKLQGQQYGDVLMKYPRSMLLSEIPRIKVMLAELQERDIDAIESWIRDNSGPLPSTEMPTRVAEIVEVLSNKNQLPH